ncbi:hypothetical protein BH10PAT1_BH10PAT1_3230 [soil metagenome]
MVNNTLLTIPNLIKAFKKAGFATKKDVEDIVHNQLTEFHANMTKPELDKLNDKADSLTSVVKANSNDIAEVKRDIHYIKDDINNIEFELSNKMHRKAIIPSSS